MREKGPHETGAREAGKAGATGFLRSPFLGALGNPLIELPERFPARPSVTPIFEYRRPKRPATRFYAGDTKGAEVGGGKVSSARLGVLRVLCVDLARTTKGCKNLGRSLGSGGKRLWFAGPAWSA